MGGGCLVATQERLLLQARWNWLPWVGSFPFAQDSRSGRCWEREWEECWLGAPQRERFSPATQLHVVPPRHSTQRVATRLRVFRVQLRLRDHAWARISACSACIPVLFNACALHGLPA